MKGMRICAASHVTLHIEQFLTEFISDTDGTRAKTNSHLSCVSSTWQVAAGTAGSSEGEVGLPSRTSHSRSLSGRGDCDG